MRLAATIIETGKVCRFLGYDPFPKPETLSERMLKFRKLRGLRVRDAAALAKIDPSSWSAWETERRPPSGPSSSKLTRFLEKNANP